LSNIALSENLREEIEANPLLEIVSGPHDFEFDSEQNLVSPFAAALAGAH
jgi:DNA-directed RNA polymerase specialized sigma54-like protein